MKHAKANSEQPRVTIRPNADDCRLLAALSKKMGLNPSNVIRRALRTQAEKEGVK